MKRVFLILFLSFMVTGIGIGVDNVYAAKPKAKVKTSKPKTVVRSTTTSKIKKKDKKEKTETAEQKKKRLAEEKRKAELAKKNKDKTSLERSKSSSIIKKNDKGKDKDGKTVLKLDPKQKSAVDKKLKRHKALKGKTFTSKKEAESAYRNSLATQKYDKRPDQRPDNVPDHYMHNGRRVETDYQDGQFGVYTSVGVFRPYGPTDFLIDALVINALTTPHVQTVPIVQTTTPVVVERPPTNENDAKITRMILIFIGFLFICGIAVFLIIKMKKSS